ncbi:DUF3558 domain-containing protein [Nocardia callitridis]|uniref:DUF3558 domain-containing protein n=1 Tax=Nocardia callitridis TaxID=648753 RepID=A0ABP9JTQ6_9NOCA
MGIARWASARGAVLAVGAAAGVVGLMVGCSSTVEGGAQTESVNGSPTREQTVQWNPCTELSDDALRAAGADPATKRVVTDAATGDTSGRICQWNSTEGPYFVSLSSTVYSQNEARLNDKITGVQDISVGPRHGLTYWDKSDDDKLACYVNVPWAKGSLEVIIDWRYGSRDSMPEAPPCSLAVQHAEILEPYLPK